MDKNIYLPRQSLKKAHTLKYLIFRSYPALLTHISKNLEKGLTIPEDLICSQNLI